MSNLIDRQVAIKELTEKVFYDYMDKLEALQVLDELPSVEPRPKGEWIPVTERLPEFNENVLVFHARSGLMCIDANIQFDRNITHWMPLPEPPMEEI